MRERGVGHRDHDLLVAGGSEPLTTAEEEPGHLTKLAHDGRPWVALLGRPLTQGIHVGRKRVARLMRAAGVRGVSRRKWVTTTTRDPEARAAPDLVQRDFHLDGPDRLWVAAITYVPTGAGFLYLAAVLDAWSRRVIGWAMATHLRTELVLAALDMALARRQPRDVIHHSDHGCQYTAVAYEQRCQRFGVRPSMGTVGDAYDNAMCESFFATFECELLDRTYFRTPAEARRKLFDHIEGWSPAAAPLRARLRVAPLLRADSWRRDPSRAGPRESEGRTASRSDVDRGACYLAIPPSNPTTAPTRRGRA